MSTLIRNIGILDARQAKPEQIKEIAKMENVGALIVSTQNKAEFVKISMLNVGKILELDDDYKLITGDYQITKQELQDSEKGVKLCVVGKVTVNEDIPLELMKEKFAGLYLVGLAEVPDKLHGAFMNATKDIIGKVVTSGQPGNKKIGNVNINNDYLQGLEDNSEIGVVGNVTFAEEIDARLFLAKIKKLSVVGVIKCQEGQLELLNKVWEEHPATKLRIVNPNYHYVPSGTRLDTFALMTIEKPVVSCSGQLFLEPDATAEIITEKSLSFDAKGAVYFPKTIMKEMVSRLTKGSKGLAYEPGKLEIFSDSQILTAARLNAMQDNSTLVVLGALDIDQDVALESISAKVGTLDNYGKIEAEKDIASILQSKLRQSEGAVEARGEESSGKDDAAYDTIIENAGNYSF